MLAFDLTRRMHTADGDIELRVALQVRPGEMVALYGSSGAGKTTLLRMIAGLSRPDSGTIRCGDTVWYDSGAQVHVPTQRRGVGLVFQDYCLFPNMTVRGNLEFALPPGAQRARVDEILAATDLGGLAQRRPDGLSGGQKQRVALARALLQSPRVLLLDEPLSALDWEMRRKLQKEILRVHQALGVPTILVSHEPGEVLRLATRVCVLEGGRVVADGSPADVLPREDGPGPDDRAEEVR
jgi:molybdate transport system ATP-binding protein